MEALGVEPVHSTEGGQLDVLDDLPRALSGSSDQFALVGGVDRLGQCIEAPIDVKSLYAAGASAI